MEIRLRRGPRQAEIIELAASESNLDDVLPASVLPGVQEHWQSEALRDGHYALEADDSEKFTPQTLNYDTTGLVSFSKGCYTGQEIVARLHYKGKAKKRIGFYAAASGAVGISSGDTVLFPAPDDTPRPVGTVLRCQAGANGETRIVAEVKADDLGKPLLAGAADSFTEMVPLG